MSISIEKVTLASSPEKQRALFGYVASDPKAFQVVQDLMRSVGNFSWSNPHFTKLWSAIASYRDVYEDRHPSIEELKASPEVIDNEVLVQKRLLQELDSALKARSDFNYAALESEIVTWRVAVGWEKGVQESIRIFNTGDVMHALRDLEDLTAKLRSLEDDTSNKLEPAEVRLDNEEEDRHSKKDKVLYFGVKYLDESTSGLLPGNIVLIGARSGAGKTQLVTRIAEFNSEMGKRVSVLALEADDREIERRIKYRYIIECAHAASINTGSWSFQDWLMDGLPEAKQFEGFADSKSRQTLKNVRTFYRNWGNFGINELHRTINQAAKDSDLIILDHIHYIDVDGHNENTEYKAVIKIIRDLAQNLKIPIIVVAHLRKSERGRKAAIVPSLDDFHGTSDLVKVATHVVTMGRPKEPEYGGPRPNGYPTYMKVIKNRSGDGVRTWPTAVTYFHNGKYEDAYAIGDLHEFDTEWVEIHPPSWCRNAKVRLLKAK